MNYHEVLGVRDNATKEEIKQAYDSKVLEIRSEVKNEKNAEAFINILTEAYEKLTDIEHTQPINIEEIKVKYKKEQDYSAAEHKNEDSTEDNYKDGQVIDYESFFDEEDNDDEFTFIDKKVRDIRKKRKKKKRKLNNNKKLKKDYYKPEEKENFQDSAADDDVHENNHEYKYNYNYDYEPVPKSNNRAKEYDEYYEEEYERKNQSLLLKLLLLPIKIILLPIAIIVWILTVFISIINLVTRIVSKILLVAAISIIVFHLYQVHNGAVMDKKIMLASGGVTFVSIFLPPILKGIYMVVSDVNDMLLDFIF